jgi:hypothetical protein
VTLAIDLDDLSRALGREVSSYDVEPIEPELRIHAVTGGVYRVRAAGESLVIKIVRDGAGLADATGGLWLAGADVGHRNYWKREWLAFDNGLLDSLPGRLRAPRTMLTTERDNGECWIWMEDVHGRIGADLTLDDYAQIGRDLGTTQGAYAAGTAAMPDDAWLSRGWLRGWVEASGRNVDSIEADSPWSDGRLEAFRPLRIRALEIWQRRNELLAAVDLVPQTVVHLDFWPMNVAAGDDGTTIAIDWSQIGIGAVAQDLDQMTLDPVWMQVRPDADPRQLERLVLDGYVAGLQEAGLHVSAETVWSWYAAAAAVKYLPLFEHQVHLAGDPVAVAAQEKRFGRSFAQIIASRARVIERAVELGELALGSTT